MHCMYRHNMQTPSKSYAVHVADAHSRRSTLPYCPTAEIRKRFGSLFPILLETMKKKQPGFRTTFEISSTQLPIYKSKGTFFDSQLKKTPPKHTVHHSNTAGLKYASKVKLACLELLMNISITATLRSEILETAEKLSTGHTTSQPIHSKFSVWVNCEDVNPMKNKGRVYTHISAGSK